MSEALRAWEAPNDEQALVDRMIDMRRKGHSYQTIANVVGGNVLSVQSLLCALGVKPDARSAYDPWAPPASYVVRPNTTVPKPALVTGEIGWPIAKPPVPLPPARPVIPAYAKSVITSVAEAAKITYEEIVGEVRARVFVYPRHLAMWLLYKSGRYSTPRIGGFFGGKDHTTVIHAIRKTEERLDEALAHIGFYA